MQVKNLGYLIGTLKMLAGSLDIQRCDNIVVIPVSSIVKNVNIGLYISFLQKTFSCFSYSFQIVLKPVPYS